MGGCVSGRIQAFHVNPPRNLNINMRKIEENTIELQNYWNHKPNDIFKENIENTNNVMKKLGI